MLHRECCLYSKTSIRRHLIIFLVLFVPRQHHTAPWLNSIFFTNFSNFFFGEENYSDQNNYFPITKCSLACTNQIIYLTRTTQFTSDDWSSLRFWTTMEPKKKKTLFWSVNFKWINKLYSMHEKFRSIPCRMRCLKWISSGVRLSRLGNNIPNK